MLANFINAHYRQISEIGKIAVFVLCCVIPFVHINHTVVYILCEIIGLYGIIYCANNWQIMSKDQFLRCYMYFLIWGIIVTIFSVNIAVSFKGFTVLCLIPLLYLGLYDGNALKHLNRTILITSIIILCLNSASFAYLYLHLHSVILQFFDHIGGGKIDSSSIAAYIIVYSLFFNQHKVQRMTIITINIVAGVMLQDANFILTMSIIFFIYTLRVYYQLAWYKILISVPIVIALVIYILLAVLHLNLHIYERSLIYAYWLPKLLYSPVHGIGFSLKLESLFFPHKFIIPAAVIAHDGHIKLHAHNYFLDLSLQSGIIGLILMVLAYYQLCKQAYQINSVYALGVVLMLVAILMKNMVDDTLEGARLLIAWFFLILSYVSVRYYSMN